MVDENKDFYNAVRQGDIERTSALLKVPGVDINFQGASGRTSLHLAVQKEDHRLVKYLLQKGADCHIKDMKGCEAGDYAKDRITRGLLASYSPSLLVEVVDPWNEDHEEHLYGSV